MSTWKSVKIGGAPCPIAVIPQPSNGKYKKGKVGPQGLITCHESRTHMWGKVDPCSAPPLPSPSHHLLCFRNWAATPWSQVFSQKGKRERVKRRNHTSLWFFFFLSLSLAPPWTSLLYHGWGAPIPLFIPWQCYPNHKSFLSSLPVLCLLISMAPLLCLFILMVTAWSNAQAQPSPGYSPSSKFSPIGFNQGFRNLWGPQHQTIDQGELRIWLDSSSGSGFKSLKPYHSGYFSAAMKLQPGYTAGVITSFYVRTTILC